MKVMCIDEKGQVNPIMHVIPFGEIVTVVGFSSVYPGIGLLIAEYPIDKYGDTCCYHKCHFAPLSDLDETVIHAERFQHEPLNV